MEIAAAISTHIKPSPNCFYFHTQILNNSPYSLLRFKSKKCPRLSSTSFSGAAAPAGPHLSATLLQFFASFLKRLSVSELTPLPLKQNGSFGAALIGATSSAQIRISPVLSTLAANPTFLSGLLAWLLAQSMKMCLNFFVERKWDLRMLYSSGGMPSSHSALCTALTTSVALSHGVADSLFPVCLGFSLIVMYDATGVRRHAGMQAEVLNMIVEDLFKGHPISEIKLKELLGHTPSQVLAGAMLGVLVAWFCCRACLGAA